MSKKTKNTLQMAVPVPPWTPKNIVKLAKYLGLSQAKVTEIIGISYSALRAWIDGRSKSISSKILSKLEEFERKIPGLRTKAEEKFKVLAEKEERRKSRLNKPWSVTRIRCFMHTWGMTQVEFAIFAGVSYDTVTSWSRGRRRLVRKETAERISFAEKVGLDRGFSKGTSNKKDSPWVLIREFFVQNAKGKVSPDLPEKLIGTFPLQVVEKDPKTYVLGKKSENIAISPKKKKDQVKVELKLGRKTREFSGTWRKLGGIKVLELNSDDKNFMKGQAGCITPAKNVLKISLWGISDLPVRMTAVMK